MPGSLVSVKAVQAPEDDRALARAKQVRASVDFPVQGGVHPSQVPLLRASAVAGPRPVMERPGRRASAPARPSQIPVPRAPAVADPRQGTEPPGATPSPATPGPVPSWAPAQVPPWGVDADDLALRDWRTQGITPGLQDIYKELRTGRRPETGFYPVSPEVALSMIAGVTARFEPLGEEGRDRTTPTEWDAFSEDRDRYLASKASRLLADEGTEPPGATPAPTTPGPVPAWALAQVLPWGVHDDYQALTHPEVTPGHQETYKELRTGRRPETGFYPVSPEVALSMITGATARFEPLRAEGRKRTTATELDAYSDPEVRDSYMGSKALGLLADEGTEPPGATTSPTRPGPVPAWALAQAPPWGVETDYYALKGWMGLGITPGMQDIYKELRTGRRSGTGSAPVGPEDAMLMTLTLIDEAYDRAPPEWDEMPFQQRLRYVKDRAWKLLSD